MKKNNKGFMLVETIIVTVVVATIMISLYVAFNRIYGAYESKKTYMDIEPIYAIDIIKDYLIDEFLIEDILSDADNNGIVNVISNKEIKIELKDYQRDYLNKIIENYNITELQIIESSYYYELEENVKTKLFENKYESYKNYVNHLEDSNEFGSKYFDNVYIFIIEESTPTEGQYIYGSMALQGNY